MTRGERSFRVETHLYSGCRCIFIRSIIEIEDNEL